MFLVNILNALSLKGGVRIKVENRRNSVNRKYIIIKCYRLNK